MFNGTDLINVDERLPLPQKSIDAYNESKVKGEQLVLAANGQKGLLTVALRPAGIFGYVLRAREYLSSLLTVSTVPETDKVSRGSTTYGNVAKHIGRLVTTKTSSIGHTLAMLHTRTCSPQTSSTPLLQQTSSPQSRLLR